MTTEHPETGTHFSRALSITLARAHPLSRAQADAARAYRQNPPPLAEQERDSAGLLPIHADGAYWRGRTGVPNIHAPGCLAFAAWRAGDADREGREQA